LLKELKLIDDKTGTIKEKEKEVRKREQEIVRDCGKTNVFWKKI